MSIEPNEINQALLSRRVVAIDREIEWEWLSVVAGQMLKLQIESNAPITLLIDSLGGSVRSALRLCDWITHLLTVPVHGVVIGECHSAATYILLCCDKRSGLPHSGYVIHSNTFEGVNIQLGGTTQIDLEQLLEEGRSLHETVVALYMKKLHKTHEEVERLIARGDQGFNERLSAREALEIGLIEGIVEGKLPIFSS